MMAGTTTEAELPQGYPLLSFHIEYKTNLMPVWRTFGWVESFGYDHAIEHGKKRLTESASRRTNVAIQIDVKVSLSGEGR